MTNSAIPSGRGWYPDPFSKGELLRLFDGASWTDQTRKMPADYDASKATTDTGPAQKKPEPKKAEKAPPRANPTKAPALEKSDQPASPFAKQGKPAKNGTAPMFATPTTKAATAPSNGPAAGDTKSEKKDTPPPAFASPTVKAERPDEGDSTTTASPFSKPAASEPPRGQTSATPAAEKTPTTPAFSFAKPANGAPNPAQPAPQPQQRPQAAATASPATGSVDDDPEEDSETVNNAFAHVPAEPSFTETYEDEAPEPRRKFGGGTGPMSRLMEKVPLDARTITWAVVALLSLAIIIVPLVTPSPLRGVAEECKPISDVVASYDGEEDFTIDQDTQADLAAVVSTGKLNEELTALVTESVEQGDLEPVVEHCLPQEE